MTRSPLILLSLLILVRTPSVAQTATDSARSPDSTVVLSPHAYGDSASRVAADTGRTAGADSSRTDSAKAAAGRADGAGARSSAAASPTVVDSFLFAACHPSSPGAGVGGILLVIFTAEATADDRQRAVKAIGGRLARQAPTGGDYVAIPDTISLHNAADLLIQQPGISQISERPC
jgi:hypothetical protein